MALRYLTFGLNLTKTYSQVIHSNRLMSITVSENAMSNFCPTISYVTSPSEEAARQLARKLVEQRLAACVNIVKNVESIYEWENKIEQDNEILLIIKSESSKSDDLVGFVKANHPYDCPEVVTMKVDSGNKSYLEWIHMSLNKKVVDPSE